MTERSTHSVLVVDDSESTRYAISRGLRAEGFLTVEAATGAQALQMLDGVSAVVLDVHLPDMLGMEVCRNIRSGPLTATLPVIHVSGVYVTEHARAAGERAGADAYLLAPVNTRTLAETIDRLLVARAA